MARTRTNSQATRGVHGRGAWWSGPRSPESMRGWGWEAATPPAFLFPDQNKFLGREPGRGRLRRQAVPQVPRHGLPGHPPARRRMVDLGYTPHALLAQFDSPAPFDTVDPSALSSPTPMLHAPDPSCFVSRSCNDSPFDTMTPASNASTVGTPMDV